MYLLVKPESLKYSSVRQLSALDEVRDKPGERREISIQEEKVYILRFVDETIVVLDKIGNNF